MRRPLVLLVCLAACAALPAAGDDRAGLAVLPGEVANTARRLAAADKLAAQQRWGEAVEEYQRILSEAGDDLVSLSSRHALAARWVCHARIAALPAEHLKAYRSRVDAQARKWLEQGAAQSDARLLKRVVAEAFCSRYGDRACDVLGDWAFERGQFGEAQRWWGLIVPPAGAAKPANPALVCPDPQVDVTRIRAKQILALLFAGEGPRAAEALKSFRGQHAKASGKLAGRQGVYADILQTLAQQSRALRSVEGTATWPTFGGDVGRGAVVTGAAKRLRRMCFQPPAWRFRLENHARIEANAPSKPPEKVLTKTGRSKAMAFQPVITGDQVLVADAHAIVAYFLHTGAPSVWFDLAREKDGFENLVSMKLPSPSDVRYTLTMAGDKVFARLGEPELSGEGGADGSQSYLVCLNLKPDKKGQRLRWLTTPDEPSRGAAFEGAPVVRGGRAYIAATRLDGGRTTTAIQCYAADAEGAAQLLWRRDVCATQELRGTAHRSRHHLLTLAGSRVVYCSHSGAIVALDAETGKNAWAVRYPTSGGTTRAADMAESLHSPRDLAPCVYAAGRLYVAPADYDRLLCLDAATGQTIWDRAVNVVHLLGATRGKLVFTAVNAVRAVDTASGADCWQMPDMGTFLTTWGRGLLVDDLVLWPTSEGLKVLHTDDGRMSSDFPPAVLAAKMPGERMGNLAYADGCLAVAGPEELFIYLAPGRQRAEREADVRGQPDSAEARFRLALAQEDAGVGSLALENFRLAAELAATQQPSLAEPARAARHDLLIDLAKQAESGQHWEEAARLLEAAASAEYSISQQVQARVRLAEMWTQAGHASRAVAAWQSLLDSPALRASRVQDTDDKPQAAGCLARARIDRLIQAHGLAIYEPIDKRARQELEAAAANGSNALPQLFARFPNAAATRAALDRRRKPTSTPHPSGNAELAIPLFRDWEMELEAGEHLLWPEVPAGGGDTLYFAAPADQGGKLTCRDAATGRTCWTSALPFIPFWLGEQTEALLVGGKGGVAQLHRTGGQLLWSFPSDGALSAFHLAGTRLFFMEDEGRLVALDASTGEVRWTRWAPGAGFGLPKPAGRFNPHFHAGNERLSVQTGGGRRWLVDAADGRLIQDVAMSEHPWRQAPLLWGRRDAAHLVMATDGQRVCMLDGKTGKETWHCELPHRGTLTGELPQLVNGPDWLLLLAPRNYGTGVQRLLASNGRTLWPNELLLTTERLAADQIACDRRAFYFVAGNVLQARGWADGQSLWSRPVSGSEGRWRVVCAGSFLIAAPMEIDSARPTWSMLLIDPQTGQLLQRLNFSIRTAQSMARKLPKNGHVQTAAPAFHLSGNALFVSVPGKACRFVSAPKESE